MLSTTGRHTQVRSFDTRKSVLSKIACHPAHPMYTRTPVRKEVIQWARDLYANAVDHKDARGFANAFTPDAWLRFGNSPPTLGREAIEAAIAGFFSAFLSLRHEAQGEYLDGNTLFLEAMVTYTRHDGQMVTVPALTIFRLVEVDGAVALPPLADQCRIFVDLSPLFAPSA